MIPKGVTTQMKASRWILSNGAVHVVAELSSFVRVCVCVCVCVCVQFLCLIWTVTRQGIGSIASSLCNVIKEAGNENRIGVSRKMQPSDFFFKLWRIFQANHYAEYSDDGALTDSFKCAWRCSWQIYLFIQSVSSICFTSCSGKWINCRSAKCGPNAKYNKICYKFPNAKFTKIWTQ